MYMTKYTIPDDSFLTDPIEVGLVYGFNNVGDASVRNLIAYLAAK